MTAGRSSRSGRAARRERDRQAHATRFRIRRPSLVLGIDRDRLPGGIGDLPAEVGSLAGDNHLLRCSLDRHKHRAQAFMAVHHIGQRRTQRVGIKRTADP